MQSPSLVILDTRLVSFGDVMWWFSPIAEAGGNYPLFRSSRLSLTIVTYSSLSMSARNNPQLLNHFAIVFYFSSCRGKLEHDFFNADI